MADGSRMSQYELGQRVRITGHTKKMRDYMAKKEGTSYPKLGLPRISDAWGNSKEVDAGIIVGVRNVADGSNNSEDGYTWFCPKPGTSRKVYLVAYDIRKRPVMVFPDQIESVDILGVTE